MSEEAEIKSDIGKRYRILSLRKCPLSQRVSLYTRGIIPGKEICLRQISPLGDPLIVEINQQTFAINRDMWSCFDLEEYRS
jgi:Fe2+ transport system protein FeoA